MARRKDPLTEPVGETVVDPLSEATDAGASAGDPVVEAEPTVVEPVSEPLPTKTQSAPRGSGLFGALLGGALAAVGGFALSHFNVLGLSAPDSSAAVVELQKDIAALKANAAVAGEARAESEVLAGRVAALEAAPVPEAPDLSRLDALDQRLAAIEAMPSGSDASTVALAAKLAELERQLAAAPPVADQAAVDAALARLEAAEAEATRRADEAAAAAQAAAETQARDALRARVSAGEGFQAELAAISDAGLVAALTPHVAGVATVEDLQADFPEAARQVLQLDRAGSTGDGWGARFVDFLAAQTGARPLTPQEGDSAEAVLSRADFALSEGRVADAVTEVRALDPAVQVPLADWLARAEARLAVLSALEGK